MESDVYPHLLRMLDILNDVGYNSMQVGPISTEFDYLLCHFQIKPLILVDAANRVFRPESEAKTVWSTYFKSV